MPKKIKKVRRGRPDGHKLSDYSKKKIAESKTGQLHSEVTKNKISCTLRHSGKRKGFNWTDERVAMLEQYLRAGLTQREIAEEMGCPKLSVTHAKSYYFPHISMLEMQKQNKE